MLLVAAVTTTQVPTLRVLGEVTESLPLARADPPAARVFLVPARRPRGLRRRPPSGRRDRPRPAVPAAAWSRWRPRPCCWNVQAGLGLIVPISVFAPWSAAARAAAPGPLRRQLAPFIVSGCATLGDRRRHPCTSCTATRHPRPPTWPMLTQVAAGSRSAVSRSACSSAPSAGAGELEELARGSPRPPPTPRLLDDLVVRALGDRSARVLWLTRPQIVCSSTAPASRSTGAGAGSGLGADRPGR